MSNGTKSTGGQKKKSQKNSTGFNGKKKISKKDIPASGIITIHTTMNNSIINVTTEKGDTIFMSSGGRFHKNSKKGTPGAAEQAAKSLVDQLKKLGVLNNFVVVIKGVGPGREVVIREFDKAGYTIQTLKDKTPIPFNGCRLRKQRRV